jgi:hypothetical protein
VLCQLAASRAGEQNIPIVVYTVPSDDEKISAGNMERLLIVIN